MKYPRLQKLFGPNTGDDHTQYSQLVTNVRDQLNKDETGNFLDSHFYGTNPAYSLNSGLRDHGLMDHSIPSVLDQIAGHGSDATKNYLNSLHEKNMYFEQPQVATQMNRNDLYEKLAQAYQKDVHPERVQNSLVSDPIANPLEGNELKSYQQLFGKEISGTHDPRKYTVQPDPKAAGDYDPIFDTVNVVDPYSLSAPAHEYMHRANHREWRIPSAWSEKNPFTTDLANSSDVAQDLQNVNNGHIKVPLGNTGDESYGEGAGYYNRIKQLLTQNLNEEQ